MTLLLLAACVEYVVTKDTAISTGAPAIVVTPDELDFGGVPLSSTSTRNVTVQNVGDATLSVTSVEIAGSAASTYTVVDGGEPFALLPGEGHTISLVYSAVSTVTDATLFVHNNDPANPAAPVPLTAQPLIGQLYATPNPIDFGNTAPDFAVSGTTTLQNVGTYDVIVDTLVVVGDAFALTDAPPLPWTLAPGDAVPVTLDFLPLSEGAFVGQLWVNANDAAGTHIIGLIGSAGVQEDETSGDPCLQDAFGYDLSPEARLFVTDATAPINLNFLGSDAGYSNDFYVETPEQIFFVNGHSDAPGTLLTIGPYPAGTEVEFGLKVRDTGDHWYSGPRSRNDDNKPHAAVRYRGDCSWTVGFEDLRGGGDQDFNDLTVLVDGPLEAAE